MRRPLIALAAAAVILPLLSACSQGPGTNPGDGGSGGNGDLMVAFLMPCSSCTTRYEEQDRPFFIEAMQQANPDVEVVAQNAQGDPATQLAQADAALTDGADLLIVNPFDQTTGAAIVDRAHTAGVPVISYDALIADAPVDLYVSFDNIKVGALQGQYLVDTLPQGSPIAVLNGAPGNGPAAQFKEGVYSALDPAIDSGALDLVYETDVPNWDPANAQQLMAQALTATDDGITGVIGSNDGQAGGIVAALDAQGIAGQVLVTGQDATLAGLQRILVGTQSMTVAKSIKQLTTLVAQITVDMLADADAAVAKYGTTTVDNGSGEIPADLLEPVVITQDNVDVIVDEGVYDWDEICADIPADACPA